MIPVKKATGTEKNRNPEDSFRNHQPRSKSTEGTMQQTLQLLDYLAMQEDAVLSYRASNMVLAVHSDASYLSKPKA